VPALRERRGAFHQKEKAPGHKPGASQTLQNHRPGYTGVVLVVVVGVVVVVVPLVF
jgi:hypothetical protein